MSSILYDVINKVEENKNKSEIAIRVSDIDFKILSDYRVLLLHGLGSILGEFTMSVQSEYNNKIIRICKK